MTEWLREGIEGRSLKATLRLYLLGLMVLAPAAALLALAFGGQASFVATPLLVFIVVAVEYAISYRARLRKDFEELLRNVRLRIVYKQIEGYRINIDQRRYISDLNRKARHTARYGQVQGQQEDVIGDPRAVDPLIGALQDKDSSVRYAAAVALEAIGDLRAVEPLVSALGDEDASVRLSAAKALWRISTLPAAQAVIAREVMETVRRMVTTDESEGEPLKDKDVSTPDQLVRKRA
jgi:hypothetical protein